MRQESLSILADLRAPEIAERTRQSADLRACSGNPHGRAELRHPPIPHRSRALKRGISTVQRS
jgi:hypothetical protein